MADLTYQERMTLERLFGMRSGYVLTYSDRTFAETVKGIAQRDIDDPRYSENGSSKAKRLRQFWSVEPNHVVARLMEEFLAEGARGGALTEGDVAEGMAIVVRLRQDGDTHAEAIAPNTDGEDFELLARSIRDAIERDEAEAALDRLHTFTVRYVRVLCEKRGIVTGRDKPLHSIFGEYVKALRADGMLHSQMAERILKSCISTFEAFNHVRNDRTFAHDNPVLPRAEATFIFTHVAATIRLLGALEGEVAKHPPPPASADPEDELPF